MANIQNRNDLLKKMICDMIQGTNDSRFLRQVYSLLFREQNRTGKLQRELHAMVEELEGEDLRLLYITALELRKQ